jgi:hypothetical protein
LPPSCREGYSNSEIIFDGLAIQPRIRGAHIHIGLLPWGKVAGSQGRPRQYHCSHYGTCEQAANCLSEMSLLDHLVGAREQRQRKFEAERLGGFKVYNQFELSGLFERQVRRVCAAQNARHEIPYARANRS